jgi:hypothetical protein
MFRTISLAAVLVLMTSLAADAQGADHAHSLFR